MHEKSVNLDYIISKYIYIYAFSRRFYPKRLTVQSDNNFFCQYMCSLRIEPTTFCAANSMLYPWAIGTCLNMPSEVPAWEVEEDACHIRSVCVCVCVCKHTYWFLWFRPGHLLAGKGSVFGPCNCATPTTVSFHQPLLWYHCTECVCAYVWDCVPTGLSSLWLSCNTSADDAQLDERAGRALLSPCGYVVDRNGLRKPENASK